MPWQAKQQLNLYTQEFKAPVLPENIKRLLLLLALNFILVLIVSATTSGISFWYQQRLLGVQQQRDFIQQQLHEERRNKPPLLPRDDLLQKKSILENQINSHRKILSYLTQGKFNSSQSLTPLVEQLGEQSIDGVWLESFVITRLGQDVALAGYVDDPAKLSPYVTSLIQRSAYKGKAFRHINVSNLTDNGQLAFELNTQPKKEKEAANAHSNVQSNFVAGENYGAY